MKTDAEIQKDVMAELKWEPILNATEIGVAVKDNVVSLTGYVSNYAKKAAAENAAWRVKGVKAVAEELEVRLQGDKRLSDAEIASSVVNTLKWTTTIPDENIKVKVTGGWVYLEGKVDWNFQKDAVFNAVKHLEGVTGVSNLLIVKPQINATVIKDNIRKALERNADLDANKISVETFDNKVVLKGTSNSWDERCAAARAAWSAPGVETVDDQIVIV